MTPKHVGAALVGCALGVLLGVLAAPAPGRSTRRRLSRRMQDERDDLVRRSHRAVGEVADYLQDFQAGRKRLAQVANG